MEPFLHASMQEANFEYLACGAVILSIMVQSYFILTEWKKNTDWFLEENHLASSIQLLD